MRRGGLPSLLVCFLAFSGCSSVGSLTYADATWREVGEAESYLWGGHSRNFTVPSGTSSIRVHLIVESEADAQVFLNAPNGTVAHLKVSFGTRQALDPWYEQALPEEGTWRFSVRSDGPLRYTVAAYF